MVSHPQRPPGSASVTIRAITRPIVAAVLLAAFIHLDWHVARPAHHHLSLGWAYHWLLAAPVFALLAWYVHRRWPEAAARSGLAIIAGAAVLAQIVEPAGELLSGAPGSWTFGPERSRVFAAYIGTGIAAYLGTSILLRMRDGQSRSAVRPVL